MAGRAPDSVLFVCGMNSIRSPMAEKLARDLFGRKMFTQSVGVRAGDPDPFMQAVMAERGIDMSTHIPTPLDDMEDSYYDLIVTLSPEAHHRVLKHIAADASEIEYWPTMDPSTVAGSREQVMEAYRQVRDTLEARIRSRFGTQ